MHVALARPVRYLLLMIPSALSESETVLALASVPEHSLPFMEAMSGGKAHVENGYLFFTGEDWLMAVAYPLTGEYDDDAGATRRPAPCSGPAGRARRGLLGGRSPAAGTPAAAPDG